jgi:hypothetical protein
MLKVPRQEAKIKDQKFSNATETQRAYHYYGPAI